MMQMLAAAGLPILEDHLRPADENNPKGYLEFEKVKYLHRDSSWLHEARGKCLKVVAPLLGHLPEEFSYRVILMRRPYREIAASQAIMIARKESVPRCDPSELLQSLEHQWTQAFSLLAARAIPFVVIDYTECLNHSDAVSSRLDSFLGVYVNRAAVAGVVDQRLYRTREGGLGAEQGTS
jgi:hypothetical protein